MSDKTEPLGKRGKWVSVPSGYIFILGEIDVELSRGKTRGKWEVASIGKVWIIKAESLSVAKARAIKHAQRAILDAAEAWKH